MPPCGSAGTQLEEPCDRPHWGFVLDGEVQLERGERHAVLGPATAFHVPAGGPPHRFRADGRARLAAFEPIEPAIDLPEAGLRSLGFMPYEGDPLALPEALVPSASELEATGEGRVVARGHVMGSLVVDYTPLDEVLANPHIADWRRETFGAIRGRRQSRRQVQLSRL